MDVSKQSDPNGEQPASLQPETLNEPSSTNPSNPFKSLKNTYDKNPKHFVIIVSIIIGLFIFLIVHRIHHSATKNQSLPVPVVLSTASKQDFPVYLNALGTVTPTQTVTVKTQINGQLLKVLFEEGQKVEEGELLAQIDPRPYEAQLLQFEGQLVRDEALLANARVDLKRFETLYPQGAVSEQTLATQKSLVQQLEGSVQFDQGQIDTVKVNLNYCNIRSPVEGRVGLRFVDPGNFVQVSDQNGLFVLNTIQPITAIFTIPEDNLQMIIKQKNKGEQFQVDAFNRTQNALLDSTDQFILDNQIDVTTGTLKLKAFFSNEEGLLFPNQFINIRLQVDTLKDATVIPTAAIQNGAKGTYVYVLNKDKVMMNPVKVLATHANFSAIKGNILPDQSVVIEGTDKLKNGTVVTVAQNHSAGSTLSTTEEKSTP